MTKPRSPAQQAALKKAQAASAAKRSAGTTKAKTSTTSVSKGDYVTHKKTGGAVLSVHEIAGTQIRAFNRSSGRMVNVTTDGITSRTSKASGAREAIKKSDALPGIKARSLPKAKPYRHGTGLRPR